MITTLKPEWPVHESVQAMTTTRKGGVSVSPFGQLNVATHVGDLPAAVQENRRRLVTELKLPAEPNWLSQTHSSGLVRIGESGLQDTPDADAAYTEFPNQVVVIMTADCLPVFLASRDGSEVALVHAGWRGIANGIIGRTLKTFQAKPDDLCAWLGPAISQSAFTVGNEVRELMLKRSAQHADAFVKYQSQWKACLYTLARQQLSGKVGFVGGGDYCTFSQPELFFSHRRDGTTGRMANLIYIS
ncbi:MAG: peptidoglycan editing factor PgeF [Idiomarina sp.]|nr:peptidoglycan editing factor PgeF [Idiomarina sp.]